MTANFTFLLDMNNYGQRLQNYALQEFLADEFGETMVTMDYDPSRKNCNPGDGKYFHPFERECMKIADIRSAGPGLLSGYDHILIGGDQVFNTDFKWTWNMRPYLTDRPDRRRNMFSYAAGVSAKHAIGRGFLAGIDLQMYAYGLREDCEGLDYVKNIDPVFLIMDKWPRVARGEFADGGVVKYVIARWGNVGELSRTDAGGKALLKATDGPRVPDPRVFVGLFRGASKAVTNSFHGVCFALMNRVPEIEIQNPNDHRIVNLKNTLGVSMDGCKVLNYDEIFAKIRLEVAKSHDYLAKCLGSSVVDYCAYSKSRRTRDMSSSGGSAPELAKVVMSRGGVVFGGAFSDDFRKVVPYCARTMDEYFAKLSKSKYSFCALPKLEDLKKELEKGAPVLYIGSPCHVRALRKLLGDVPDNLMLVDFRCRGYSRPDKLAKMVDYVEGKFGRKVDSLDFRPFHRSEVLLKLHGGGDVRYSSGIWCKFIYDTLPMCRTCSMVHGVGLSCADITLADFWGNGGNRLGYGIDFTPEMGCSLVTVNTEKGAELWDAARKSMECRPLLGRR